MQAHKTRMFWFSLLLAGLLTSALACNRPRKVEVSAQGTAQESESAEPGAGANAPTAPAADDSTSLPDAGAPRTAPVDMVGEFASDSSEMVASSVVRPMAVDDLTGRLKRLKFQARREIVAARTAIENIPSYTRSLEKFEREFAEWGMFTAVPAEPGYDDLKGAIAAVVKRVGLELVYYNVIESKATPRRLPEIIHGDKSFEFEDGDVRQVFQVAIRVSRAEREQVLKLVAELKALDRLLLIRRVKPLPESILVNMDAYWFGEERYPLHQVLPRDLKTEMERLGITGSMEEVMRQDAVGHLQNAALSYRELNSSLPKLNEAMGLLSRSKFLEARSAFYRKAVEAAATTPPIP